MLLRRRYMAGDEIRQAGKNGKEPHVDGSRLNTAISFLAFYCQFWHISKMNDLPPLPNKALAWIGRAYDELMELPAEVRRSIGYALHTAQEGSKHDSAKPLKGFKGAGVLEVVENYDGDTYRAVYTVKFANAVYVLHCFQKKSKKGIATPKSTIDLIERRFKEAAAIYKEKETQK
jgi:phage-related protein